MSYTLISTQTVGAGGAASIDFTSIPQVYTDLVVVYSTRPGTTDTSWIQTLRLNGVSTNLAMRTLEGTGTAVSSGTNSTKVDPINQGTDGTAATFANGSIHIPNYAGATNKIISIDSVSENNTSTAYTRFATGQWGSAAAVTQVSLLAPSTYAQYSTASLYGIKRIPTASLGTTPTVDYLVVAGGGAGGYDRGGGGGAGGFLTGAGLSVASGTPLTVTVGGGGTGQSSYTAGTPGGSSVFSSITTVGGGVGNWGGQGNGTSGGSGGGAGSGTSSSGGAGTANQGYAGGGSGINIGAGGGGGAGGVGETRVAVNGTGGYGGPGLSSTYSGSTIYYAGGGGGGAAMDFSAPIAAGAGGIGGGGAGGYGGGVGGVNGSPNTGGGGGGGSNISQGKGGNGGSGIVIIRYPDTYAAPTTVTGSPMVTFVNGYRVYTWTTSGSITF